MNKEKLQKIRDSYIKQFRACKESLAKNQPKLEQLQKEKKEIEKRIVQIETDIKKTLESMRFFDVIIRTLEDILKAF